MFDALSNLFTHTWVWHTITVVYILTVAAVVTVVLSENRNPVRSLAWITVLILLPVIGIVLYVFFGRSLKNKHIISRRNRRRLKRAVRKNAPAQTNDFPEHVNRHIALAHALSGAIFNDGNDVRLFTNGREKFDAMLEDLRKAQRYICLEYYIIEDDEIGNAVADVLIDRARNGVKVKMIYDHVGCWHTPRRFFKRLRKAGVEVHPFFRVALPVVGSRVNWRNHRKICIVDGRVAYVGGMNIADRYIRGTRRNPHWRDSHVRVTGPALAAIQSAFDIDWAYMSKETTFTAEAYNPQPRTGNVALQMLTSGPASQWENAEVMFLQLITSATKRVFIQTPYFLPTESLLKALQAAALSRVDVRLMLPQRSDSSMLTAVSHSYFSECMRAGIKIYLYQPGMLHSKTIIIDNDITTVGSVNFDFRSFEHNFEVTLIAYSHEFNTHMADIFVSDITQCLRVMPDRWRRRPLHRRAIESVLRPLSPIL